MIIAIIILMILCCLFGIFGTLIVKEWHKPENPFIEIREVDGHARLYFSDDVMIDNSYLNTLSDIKIGDRHMDTIEKAFDNNEFKYPKEAFKYTFENGESTNSDHPLNYNELKPFVEANGPVKQDGLEVIKS